MNQDEIPTAPQGTAEYQPAPRSSGRKWFLGCGGGCLVIIIAILVIGWLAVRAVRKMVTQFEDQGFVMVQGQDLEITEPITTTQLFIAQQVTIKGDCATDIAIIADDAQIHSRIAGTVYFRGRNLTILPTADVHGDLDVQAQTVTVQGRLTGQVKGTVQKLNSQPTDPIPDPCTTGN